MKIQDGVNWAVNQLGKSIDKDSSHGAQCADFIIAFTTEHFDVWPEGNAVDFIDYDWTEDFQVLKGSDQTPQRGDIFVFGGEYGHTGIVTEADGDYFNSIDQNFYNASSKKGSPAAFIENHEYNDFIGVIRPPYEDAAKGKSNKASKIETINETINYNMPDRSGSVQGVVIHNTAGNNSAKQSYNNLSNASVARYEAGIAHYYIDRNTVWRAIDTYSVAWHTAKQRGNNGFLGYEVNQSMNASNKDFMANEQAVFKKAAADMLYYGLPVNRSTVELHNNFVATACPHRSMLIHTGFDPIRQGAAPTSVRNELKDYFIKEIKKYYNNPALQAGASASDEVPDKETIPTPTPAEEAHTANADMSVWSQNEHGTWYKSERGTFTCGNTEIASYVGSPYIDPNIFGYWFQPNGYVDYDEVCLQDDHVFIGYTWQNVRYYMPIREWNEVAPPNHGVGDMWGFIR